MSKHILAGMRLTRWHDAFLAMALLIGLISLVLIWGDVLYVGIWYYLLVLLFSLFIVWALKVPPLFQTGSVFAIVITFLIYLTISWNGGNSEGLLGLGHLFSLPGAALGLIVSAFFVKNRTPSGTFFAFSLSVIGILVGFFINQLIVCNTLMWCGFLTFSKY